MKTLVLHNISSTFKVDNIGETKRKYVEFQNVEKITIQYEVDLGMGAEMAEVEYTLEFIFNETMTFKYSGTCLVKCWNKHIKEITSGHLHPNY